VFKKEYVIKYRLIRTIHNSAGGDKLAWNNSGLIINWEKQKILGEKSAPVPFCLPSIPQEISRDLTGSY
jgi:hypothetical protein